MKKQFLAITLLVTACSLQAASFVRTVAGVCSLAGATAAGTFTAYYQAQQQAIENATTHNSQQDFFKSLQKHHEKQAQIGTKFIVGSMGVEFLPINSIAQLAAGTGALTHTVETAAQRIAPITHIAPLQATTSFFSTVAQGLRVASRTNMHCLAGFIGYVNYSNVMALAYGKESQKK